MVKSLEIESFKKFQKAQIELRPKSLSIVVGGNNSGKSSLLQALSLWNYAKSRILFFKGRSALNNESKKDGVGISIDDFTPLHIPSFEYLWTNLSATGSYTMKINLKWNDVTDTEKHLQIAFSLVQDRLYAKKFSSNLNNDDLIPEIAYLPPFAGITEKEPWLSNADRRKQIGRGLSGSVLRNLIYDYYLVYLKELEAVKQLAKRKQGPEKKRIYDESIFGQINNVLAEVFSVQLYPEEFSQEFHNYLRIPLRKGNWSGRDFRAHSSFSARDIMAEGRGFLQWLNTFCLLLDSKINVLLLDEPDAHLHATLQIELIKYLEKFAFQNNKQVLIATHSSEVVKSVPPSIIMDVSGGKAEYCKTESQIKKILFGIGIEHFPLLYKIQTNKKVVFVENKFDEDILRKFAIKLEMPIADDVVFWPIANNHKERKHVFIHLKDQINGLKMISLEDKDNLEYSVTQRSLLDKDLRDIVESSNGYTSKFLYRRWRRWELENYLINPKAIAGLSQQNADIINSYLQSVFSITWPLDFRQSDRTNSNAPLFDLDGKNIVEWFQNKYNFIKHDLPDHFDKVEIPEDIITLINDINTL